MVAALQEKEAQEAVDLNEKSARIIDRFEENFTESLNLASGLDTSKEEDKAVLVNFKFADLMAMIALSMMKLASQIRDDLPEFDEYRAANGEMPSREVMEAIAAVACEDSRDLMPAMVQMVAMTFIRFSSADHRFLEGIELLLTAKERRKKQDKLKGWCELSGRDYESTKKMVEAIAMKVGGEEKQELTAEEADLKGEVDTLFGEEI